MSTAASKPRPLKLRVHSALRWVHIYASMFSLLAVLFFSATGLTLNHPDWLAGAVHETRVTGSVPAGWVDDDGDVAKLEVVERLRAQFGVRGALDTFQVDERECMVSFKGPGYSADGFIDRTSGALSLTIAAEGAVAVMNDLHKGRHTGRAWAWAIDVAAIFLILLSVTGLGLLLYLKRLRRAALLTAGVGIALTLALMRLAL